MSIASANKLTIQHLKIMYPLRHVPVLSPNTKLIDLEAPKVKTEPGAEYQVWPCIPPHLCNTKDNPIVIDDDVPPPVVVTRENAIAIDDDDDEFMPFALPSTTTRLANQQNLHPDHVKLEESKKSIPPMNSVDGGSKQALLLAADRDAMDLDPWLEAKVEEKDSNANTPVTLDGYRTDLASTSLNNDAMDINSESLLVATSTSSEAHTDAQDSSTTSREAIIGFRVPIDSGTTNGSASTYVRHGSTANGPLSAKQLMQPDTRAQIKFHQQKTKQLLAKKNAERVAAKAEQEREKREEQEARARLSAKATKKTAANLSSKHKRIDATPIAGAGPSRTDIDNQAPGPSETLGGDHTLHVAPIADRAEDELPMFVQPGEESSGVVDDDDENGREGDGSLDEEQRYAREFRNLEKAYKKAKRAVKAKEKAGADPDADEQEIMFMRLERKYNDMKIQRQQAKDAKMAGADAGTDSEDNDPALYEQYSDSSRLPNHENAAEFSDNDDDDDPMARHFDAQARALPNVRPKSKQPATACPGDELVSNRRKRTAMGRTRKSKATAKTANDVVLDGNAKVRKKGGKEKRKVHSSGQDGQAMLQSMITANVIRDAQVNAGKPGLPGFKSTRKSEALKALIASIPEGSREEAKIGQADIDKAMRDFAGKARTETGTDELRFRITGMKSTLMAHQLIGSAFMRRRERDTIGPHGGIFADQMGLGKTVMMLANIINGRPIRKTGIPLGPKTTLIVAYPALALQWEGEIQKHCETQGPKSKMIKVHKQFGQDKFQGGGDDHAMQELVGNLEGYDIVLTTYGEVRKSYPKAEYPLSCVTAQEKSDWWRNFYNTKRGLLHRTQFLRIVLDEAQEIKNHKSHTSIACRGLNGSHRWAMSGTPIQNSAKELYPYFNFLKVENTGSFGTFCNNYIGSNKGPTNQGYERLHCILKKVMLRRTHQNMVMGAPLVILPTATEQTIWLKFNDVERNIYNIVEARMIKRVNMFAQTKQLEANYTNMLTMLLRLRQLTGHLLTIEKPMRDLLEQEDLQKIYVIASAEKNDLRKTLRAAHIKTLRRLLAAASSKDTTSHSGSTQDALPGAKTDSVPDGHGSPSDANTSFVDKENTGGCHGLDYDWLKYQKTFSNTQNLTKCVFCMDKAVEPYITSCYHIYCKECLHTRMESAAHAGENGTRCVASECSIIFTSCAPYRQLTFDSNGQGLDDATSEEDAAVLRKRNRRKMKGVTLKKALDWIDQEGKNVLPSTKTIAIKAQVINWIEENENVKIIVYTQFIDMIRILAKVCDAESWGKALYHGGQSQDQRRKALDDFKNNANIRILLCSLKAGGTGLNLTMAQNVIIVDPWWNNSVDQQAFCRVFRIGQECETSLTKFVVLDTVDQRLMELQERKQLEIDQVMDSKRARRRDTKELFRLFGDEVGENADGTLFVMTKHHDTIPNPLGGDEEDQMDAT